MSDTCQRCESTERVQRFTVDLDIEPVMMCVPCWVELIYGLPAWEDVRESPQSE